MHVILLLFNNLCCTVLFLTWGLGELHIVYAHDHARYEIIATLLDCYTRPITILDLGALDECLISEIASHYDATMVIVSRDKQEILEALCTNTCLHNLILLKKELSLAHLERLAECEHFDVTLVLDDFNALPLMRKKAINVLVNLGDYMILAVPQGKKQKGMWTRADEIRSFLIEAGSIIIDELIIEDANIFITYKPKMLLKRSYWHNPRSASVGEYCITSTFDKKYLYKQVTNKFSVWHAGINVHTFKALSGVYPSQVVLLDTIQALRDFDHNDYNPCNFVIQGRSLVPIDLHDPRRYVDQAVGYERLVHLVGC